MSRRILIAGCGDVGIRCGLRLSQAGDEVWGLRRRPDDLPAGLRPLAGDLADRASLEPPFAEWDAIVYCPAPGERTERAYETVFLTGQENLARRVSARRFLFVSSTAVYGQDDGSWVDENSPTEPGAFNGSVLLAGEALAARCWERPVVVRFGGIYGPGRDRLLRLVRAGAGEIQADPPQWTNRIFADDCAAMLQFLLVLEEPAGVYNGVDGAPTARFEVMRWLARELGAPPPRPVAGGPGSAGKRVSSARVRRAGFRFAYPDYRAGYGALLAQ